MLGDTTGLGGFSHALIRPRELRHCQTNALGRGVMIPTPVGDHHYPVEVLRDAQGNVRHVRVRFVNQEATDTTAMPEYLFRAWLDTVRADEDV
ncbi:MAG: hypothetical protein M3R24_42480 [Chloroflexota bacterium]|nr:hypothetical protein [Chloroflexota bacterium]